MTVNSDWQELRELSDEERTQQIKYLFNEMRKMHDYSFEIYDLNIYYKFQQHLDRIKALVMSRGEGMNQAEKLQKLIELAHKNGWIYNPYGEPFLDESYLGLVNLFCRGDKVLNYEVVIFDHEFIKALCKIEKTYDYYMMPEIIKKPYLEDWDIIIKRLAISENRIDYLYDIFISCNQEK